MNLVKIAFVASFTVNSLAGIGWHYAAVLLGHGEYDSLATMHGLVTLGLICVSPAVLMEQ